mgnify:CR=1 FL=1
MTTRKKNPMNFKTIVLGLVAILTVVACKKEFDAPPIRTLPVGEVITLKQLRAMHVQNANHKFVGDTSIYAVVTADEVSGNLYKTVYAQDDSAAIVLKLVSSGGIYIGDSIRIVLKGTFLNDYNGMVQLDSVNVDNNVVKQATQVFKTPELVTISELAQSYTPRWDHPFQGKLVMLDSVQFVTGEAIGSTYSVGQTTVNRNIENCIGQSVFVRNSGYSNFATNPLPQGRGTFVGVLGTFDTDAQLYIRNINEIQLNGPRCNGEVLPIFNKDFGDGSMISGGWTQQAVIGNIPWTYSTLGGGQYGLCKNYFGTNTACESWYISPSIDLSNTKAPVLTFQNASNYTGAQLELLFSTDYVGGAPSSATWSPIQFTLSSGGFVWISSGTISLLPYMQSNFHLAFKYVGSNFDGKTWEIDDIRISDQ